jgi:hypothetical protein
MAQVQCSNCGSYNVSVQDQGSGCALLYTILFGGLLGLAGLGIMALSLDGLFSDPGSSLSMCGSGFMALAIGWGPFILVSMAKKNYLAKCDNCGREWDTRHG